MLFRKKTSITSITKENLLLVARLGANGADLAFDAAPFVPFDHVILLVWNAQASRMRRSHAH